MIGYKKSSKRNIKSEIFNKKETQYDVKKFGILGHYDKECLAVLKKLLIFSFYKNFFI